MRFEAIRRAKHYYTQENECVIETESDGRSRPLVGVGFVQPNVIRYRLFPGGPLRDRPFPALLGGRAPAHINHGITEQRGSISLLSDELKIGIELDPWQVTVEDASGRVVWKENHEDLSILGEPVVRSLGATFDGDGRVLSISEAATIFDREAFYGFGERFGPLNKRGTSLVCWHADAYGVGTDLSYKNVPFFMSTRGYGLFVASSSRATFHMGSRSFVSYNFEIEDEWLDVYILYGPSLKRILGDYTALTGRPAVPPKWSFGLWMSRSGGYRNRAEVEGVARELRDRDIPCDLISIDPFWLRRGSYCDFVWDEHAFPNPEGMIELLSRLGFRVCLWEHPYLSVKSDAFKYARDRGYLVRTEDGSPYVISYGLSESAAPGECYDPEEPATAWAPPVGIVDFSNDEACRWYQEMHGDCLDMGVATFMTDFGESVPEDGVFSNGETGKTMHNLYPLLYNQAVFEFLREKRGDDAVVWARSGFAGSQRYPTCWAGDALSNYPSLACTVRGGLSATMSGFAFWSHDIGGLMGDPSPDLFIRWAQFGLLCSHARCHGVTPREPWEFGTLAETVFRRFAKLRYELLPYIYTYACLASSTGLPVIRPMVLEYQHDPNTYDKDLQYMLGEYVLVAPVTNEDGNVTVYLPAGGWMDFWTHKEYQGPLTVQMRVPLDIVPLFIRGNSIIPKAEPGKHLKPGIGSVLTVEVFLADEASFELIEGKEKVRFLAGKLPGLIEFAIDGDHVSSRCYEIRFNGLDLARGVLVAGVLAERVSSEIELRDRTGGWCQIPGTGTVVVKATVAERSSGTAVTIELAV